MEAERGLLGVEDVADFLCVSKASVYRWVERGDLSHYKVGRSIRVSLSSS